MPGLLGLGWTPADTGTLRTDLQNFGMSLSGPVETPEGRILFRSSLPIDGDPALRDVRAEFWSSQFDSATGIAVRAGRRSELRQATDHLDMVRMFCSAAYFDVLYLDAAITAPYLDSVVDIVLRGVASRPVELTPGERQQVTEQVGGTQVDVLGEQKAAVDYAQSSRTKIREAILDAMIKEATLRGPEFVTLDAVARRSGVTTAVVERMWSTVGDLLTEAGSWARQKTRPVPDTGSLWGDLLSFTASKARLTSTEDARANFLSTILRDPSAKNAAVVVEFWAAGLRESTKMLLRAQERGDLRECISPDFATRALVVSLYYDLFFTGGAMSPPYTAQVLDVFLNGVTERANR